jgi:hypothetical protein
VGVEKERKEREGGRESVGVVRERGERVSIKCGCGCEK